MKGQGRHYGYTVAAWAGNVNKTIAPTSVYTRWLVHKANFSVVADATVASRSLLIYPHSYDVSVALTTGPTFISSAVTAGQTRYMAMGPAAIAKAAGFNETDVWVLNGQLWLSQSFYWIVTLSNGVAGDAVSAQLEVEEFSD